MTEVTDIRAAIRQREERAGARHWIEQWAELNDDALEDRWRDDVLEAAAAGMDAAGQEQLLRFLRDRTGIGVQALRRTVRALAQPNEPGAAAIGDQTTAARAHQWIRAQEELGGWRPGPGCFYYTREEDPIWRTMSFDTAQVLIGDAMSGPQANTPSDYRNIAKHALKVMMNDEHRPPLDAPAAGVAVNDVCLRLKRGKVSEEELSPIHYCRFRIEADRNQDTGDYANYLATLAPEGSEHWEDIRLAFGQAAFMVLFNLGEMMQKAILFYGAAGSGKSTGQAILSALVPQELRCSVEPNKWGSEYQMAHMSRAVLNVVEDVDYKGLLGAEFKRLVGNQTLVSAREPYGAAFDFRPNLTHLFSANELLATRIHDRGFFRRWHIIFFPRSIEVKSRINGLAQTVIEQDLGAVIRHAIEAGRSLFDESGKLVQEQRAFQDIILNEWEREQNIVLQFLEDDEWVKMGEDLCVGRALLYDAFKRWSRQHGYAELGHRTYVRELKRLAGQKNVHLRKRKDDRVWVGLEVTGVGLQTF